MRRDTHFVIHLPPTPREDSAFPSPVSKNPPHRHLNPEYVYPTPSPTTINRSFFASPSEWYDIAGSEEDGEPSVKELEMLEQKDVLCLQEYAEEIHGYLRGLEGRSSVGLLRIREALTELTLATDLFFRIGGATETPSRF
jgi:hypothetical protein